MGGYPRSVRAEPKSITLRPAPNRASTNPVDNSVHKLGTPAGG